MKPCAFSGFDIYEPKNFVQESCLRQQPLILRSTFTMPRVRNKKKKQEKQEKNNYCLSFTLPLKDSYIAIRVENLNGKIHGHYYSHWIIGKVRDVTYDAHQCSVRAGYLDRDFKEKVVYRLDTLMYSDYGGTPPRNWRILTPRGVKEHGFNIKKLVNQQGYVKIPESADKQPLSTQEHDDQRPIGDVACQACNDTSACHPQHGAMIICSTDNCETGLHLKCAVPPLDAVPAGSWLCDTCLKRKHARETRQTTKKRTDSELDVTKGARVAHVRVSPNDEEDNPFVEVENDRFEPCIITLTHVPTHVQSTEPEHTMGRSTPPIQPTKSVTHAYQPQPTPSTTTTTLKPVKRCEICNLPPLGPGLDEYCKSCKDLYHRDCVGLEANEIEVEPVDWRCAACTAIIDKTMQAQQQGNKGDEGGWKGRNKRPKHQ